MKNNVTIDMYKKPRSSGKTARLKLNAFEAWTSQEYDYIHIVGHSSNSTQHLRNYLKYMGIQTSNVLRGISGKRLLILIDEPFMMKMQDQIELLSDIEILSSRFESIKVFGIGTPPNLDGFMSYIRN